MRCAILAGGGATRLGGIMKGLATVGPSRMIDRVAAAAAPLAEGPILLVANEPGAGDWLPGAVVIPDRFPGAGPLGGLAAALAAAEGPVLCLAWDLPFLTTPLLAAVVSRLGGADACLPESGGRRGVEPLCGVYTSACLAPIETRLAAGDRRAVGFHGLIELATVPLAEVRRFGDPGRLFFNVNTPDDLATARAWASASARSEG